MATNEEIVQAWEEFKSTNDQRLAEIEARASSDPLSDEKLARIEETLSTLTNSVDAVAEEQKSLAKKSGRPAVSASSSELEYKTAFTGFVRNGRGEDALEAKALTLTGSTNNDGGHTVPDVIDMAVRSRLINQSPMRQLAQVISTTTGLYSVLMNVHGTASGWVAETDARTETASPKINKIAVPGGELYVNVAATQQLLDDSAIDVEGWLAKEIADQFAVAEGTAFITGTGVNQPKGILATGTGIATVAGGSAAALDKSDALISLVYALKAGHRQGSVFLGNSATEATIRKLKDTTGNYLWAPGLNGERGKLLGYEFFNDENMPDVAANATPLAFGNFQNGYTIADRTSYTLVRDPYTNKPYVMFYVTARVGGVVTDAEALKLLKIAAS